MLEVETAASIQLRVQYHLYQRATKPTEDTPSKRHFLDLQTKKNKKFKPIIKSSRKTLNSFG